MLAPRDFFDLAHCPFPELFDGVELVWEALPRIAPLLERLEMGIDPTTRVHPTAVISGPVRLGAGTVVEAGAVLEGPLWLGDNCTVRAGALVRPNVIAGDHAVLGFSCEFKHCLLHHGANAYHLAYVGDSILGAGAHLGAGVVLSNRRLDTGPVRVRTPLGEFDTGLDKLGAILGDRAEVGCGCVLNPGALVGPRAVLYPLSSWRGYLPPDHVAKLRQSFETVERRDRA